MVITYALFRYRRVSATCTAPRRRRPREERRSVGEPKLTHAGVFFVEQSLAWDYTTFSVRRLIIHARDANAAGLAELSSADFAVTSQHAAQVFPPAERPLQCALP